MPSMRFHFLWPSRARAFLPRASSYVLPLRKGWCPSSRFGTYCPSTKSEKPNPVPSVTHTSTPLPWMAPYPCTPASFSTRVGFRVTFPIVPWRSNPAHDASRFGADRTMPSTTTPGNPTEIRSYARASGRMVRSAAVIARGVAGCGVSTRAGSVSGLPSDETTIALIPVPPTSMQRVRGPSASTFIATRSVMALLHRREPTTGRQPVRLGWSPRPLLVRVDRSRGLDRRIDDAPRLFHVVLAREAEGVARDRIAEKLVVGLDVLAFDLVQLELHLLARELLARCADHRAERDHEPRAQAKAEVVRRRHQTLHQDRRLPEPDEDLGAGDRKALPGADEERHTLPAPGIHVQPKRRERLGGRFRRDPRLLTVSPELAAHDVRRLDRGDAFQHLHLLVADGLQVGRAGRRLHGDVGDDLEQVVLHHVADRAGPIIEAPAALHSEIFRHGDLDLVDIVAIPDRFQERICESEEDEVLDGALSQIMIDAEDVLLREMLVQHAVQRPRRLPIAPEGFLDDEPRPVHDSGTSELPGDQPEQPLRDGHVVHRAARTAERPFQFGEGSGVLVIAIDVLQELEHPLEGALVDAAVLLEAPLGAPPELLQVPALLGDPDDRDVEDAAPDHPLQRGKDLLVGEISGGPVEDERVGLHDFFSW